jgi:hypothetical protein
MPARPSGPKQQRSKKIAKIKPRKSMSLLEMLMHLPRPTIARAAEDFSHSELEQLIRRVKSKRTQFKTNKNREELLQVLRGIAFKKSPKGANSPAHSIGALAELQRLRKEGKL